MYKFLLLAITVTLGRQCQNPGNHRDATPVLCYGTSQTWVGGTMGAGKGTDYYFFLTNADSTCRFDSVWINDYRLALVKDEQYQSADTLLLSASAFFPGSGPKAPESNSRSAPEKALMPCCAGSKAVIRFYKNGTTGYLSTDNIKILKGIYYR